MNKQVTPPANDPVKDRLDAPDRGREDYPPYDYLWHLDAIGVLETSYSAIHRSTRVKDTLWGLEGLSDDPATIALIDTGVAAHPNLFNRLDTDRAIDLGTAKGGAVYRGGRSWQDFLAAYSSNDAMPEGRPRREPRGTLAGFEDRDEIEALLGRAGLGAGWDKHDLLVELMTERTRGGVALRDLSIQDQRYPTHGTSAAGLVVGTPIVTDQKKPHPAYLPYFGIDPWSRVLPIATSFEPEPLQLTFALLYAFQQDVDVILMPRGADNPSRAPRTDPRENAAGTRYDELDPYWDLFDEVFVSVSRHIPIVCAAGNEGDDRMIYPAVLAHETGNNGIIAVGAVSAAGRRSGYGSYGPGLTLVAPSSDGEVYSRHQMRIDSFAREARSHEWTIHAELEGAYVPHAHQAILTTDIVGPRGYTDDVAPVGGTDVGADFALFGGTSAASSIVAGVVALMRRAHPDNGWSGTAVKEILMATANGRIGDTPLTPDISNASDHDLSDDELHERLFGAGMVDARAAVLRILDQRSGRPADG